MRGRRLWALLLSLTTACAVGAGSAVVADPAPAAAAVTDSALAAQLRSVMRDSRVVRARSGAIVIHAATGGELYARDAGRSITPASNTKIVTAAAAMHTLGPGFRFSTRVIRRARLSGGVLHGRLYLKGYGDPTSRRSDYASLARQVRAAGIRTVTGKLIVDATYFDANRYNSRWSTGYADDYYAAEISALTVAPNDDLDSGTVIIKYRPGARGKKAKISFSPAAAANYIDLVNKTTTGKKDSGTTFTATRRHGSNTITVSGRVPQGRATGQRLITVHRPERYAAAVFRSELRKAGVTVRGRTLVAATPKTGRTVVAIDRSMTLSRLLVPFMKLSNNMHAEALTKAMGAQTGVGSWSRGLVSTRAYLRRSGASLTGVALYDGSGLSRSNKLTPRALARLLVQARAEPWFGAFYAALPVAGNTTRMTGGTLRHRMNRTRAANNARAKTGTLTGVTALSGYVRGRGGRLYVFSMLSEHNGRSPRPVENELVVRLADWRR